MSDNEKIIGFSAREMWLDPKVVWDSKKKEDSLFRVDVYKPLSVDDMVWPSVFDVDTGLTPPSWKGYIQNHWDKLERLQKHLEAEWGSNWKPCWIIGVTLLYSLCSKTEREEWNGRMGTFVPPNRSESWSFLGFDVADMYLTSSLSNCWFQPSEEDVQALRNRWIPLLNKFHLFNDLDQAIEFKNLSDKRVPEHAPFYIYGLWLISKRGMKHER